MSDLPGTSARSDPAAGVAGEASFRALVEHLPALVWSVNADGVADYYSPPLLAYLGKTREEMDRRAWRDAVHPDDHAGAFEAWERARRTGAPCSFDARFRRASDGAYRWLTSRAQPIREGGAVVRWVGTLVDVHDRVEADHEAHLAREELHHARDMFNALLEAAPVAMWVKDTDGRYLLANRPVGESTGRVSTDLVGKSDVEVMGEEVAAVLREHDRIVLATDHTQAFEERIARADGAHTYLAVKFPVRDETGAPFAVGGVATDITERKRFEAALRESEERARERAEELQTLLHATPAAIMIAHDTACTRITGSRGAYAILRVDERANLSKSALDPAHLAHFQVFHEGELLAPEDLPVQRAARGEEISAYEEEIVFDDGTRRYLYGNAVPLRDPEGRPRGAVGAFVDVTALRLAEQERERLLEREQAARAAAEAESRAKDEFLATVSHELRTPLNAILGWTQILLAQEHSPDTQHAIGTIERNARLQARLVEDILDASRIVTGTLRLETRPVELAPLVQTVLESQRPAADAKGIHLATKLDPMVGPVLGDPPRLQQVVWNLVSNAVKFTPELGTVSIALERAGKEVRLVVRDTGVGIAPEFLPHLFRPFRQAETGASRRHGGLGLGLSIVQHLVELHGGTVGVESRGPGQGATFIVCLPLTDRVSVAPEAAGPESTRAAAALRGARILVVDDEPFARALLARILVDRGAVVRACASAAEALGDLAAWRPDVLVSDVGMPERDGYWLIDRVRALPEERGGATPALAITAYASVADRVRALSRGYQLHVPKPLDVDELVVSVAALVGRGGAARHV